MGRDNACSLKPSGGARHRARGGAFVHHAMSRLHASPAPSSPTAMTPTGTVFLNGRRASSHAAWGLLPAAIRSYTDFARTRLTISSPTPVAETAPSGPQ